MSNSYSSPTSDEQDKYRGRFCARLGMRDTLTHHYSDLAAEVVYTVCATYIEGLAQTIERMLGDLDS